MYQVTVILEKLYFIFIFYDQGCKYEIFFQLDDFYQDLAIYLLILYFYYCFFSYCFHSIVNFFLAIFTFRFVLVSQFYFVILSIPTSNFISLFIFIFIFIQNSIIFAQFHISTFLDDINSNYIVILLRYIAIFCYFIFSLFYICLPLFLHHKIVQVFDFLYYYSYYIFYHYPYLDLYLCFHIYLYYFYYFFHCIFMLKYWFFRMLLQAMGFLFEEQVYYSINFYIVVVGLVELVVFLIINQHFFAQFCYYIGIKISFCNCSLNCFWISIYFFIIVHMMFELILLVSILFRDLRSFFCFFHMLKVFMDFSFDYLLKIIDCRIMF